MRKLKFSKQWNTLYQKSQQFGKGPFPGNTEK